MKTKIIFIIMSFFLLLPVILSAQTAAELENVLQTQEVTYAQATRFVLASGLNTDAANDQNAYEWAVSNKWVPKNTSPDEAITLSRLSFLIMKAFDMKGGLMYSFFPGPRYAYRTMVSRSYIQGTADPSMKVSGENFLLILGRVLSAEGDEI